MINHPDLFDEFGEGFALLEFRAPELESLRQKVVDHLSQAHDTPPTADELRRALSSPDDPFAYEEGGAVLDEILSSATYRGPGKAANPDAALEQAGEAWKAVWASIEQEKIDAERLQRTKDSWTN